MAETNGRVTVRELHTELGALRRELLDAFAANAEKQDVRIERIDQRVTDLRLYVAKMAGILLAASTAVATVAPVLMGKWL